MRAYPRPHDFRYHDSERLASLGSEYGLSTRPRRTRPPSDKERVTAAFLVGASFGATWLLVPHFREK